MVDATASDRAPSDRVRALVTLAHVERREGRPDDAEDHAHEALRLSRPMGHKRGVVDALEVLACCAVDAQSPAEAARLLGAADALRRATGYQYRSPLAQRPLAESVVALDAALSAEGRDRAWAEGEALSLEDACDVRGEGSGRAQVTGDRLGGADRDRGSGGGPRRRRVDERPGRRAAVHLPPHRRQSSAAHLREARRLDPGRARHAGGPSGWRRRVMFGPDRVPLGPRVQTPWQGGGDRPHFWSDGGGQGGSAGADRNGDASARRRRRLDAPLGVEARRHDRRHGPVHRSGRHRCVHATAAFSRSSRARVTASSPRSPSRRTLLACALELQLEWGRESWPFRVRLALHTGEVQTRDGDTVRGHHDHPMRAVRSRSRTEVRPSCRNPPTISWPISCRQARGSTTWESTTSKTSSVPTACICFDIADLPLVDTPLLSADAALANLPVQLTSFIGREREIDAVLALMRTNRIVSVLGVGGCGKTRLSVEVASRAVNDFPDGLWFVELAPIDDSDLVAPNRVWRRSAVASSPDGPRSKRSRVRSPDAPPCSSWTTASTSSAAAAKRRVGPVVRIADALDSGDVPRAARSRRRGHVHGSEPVDRHRSVGAVR